MKYNHSLKILMTNQFFIKIFFHFFILTITKYVEKYLENITKILENYEI